MKRIPSLILPLLAAMALVPAVAAENAGNAGTAAVARLGAANGQALACRQPALSARARNALVTLAPKTRAFGELFETETNRRFLAPEPCAETTRLATEVDAAIVDLRLAFPASRHSETGASTSSAEIVPRYMLLDHNGRTVSDQDFAGRFQLLTFGYTSCPDVCPTTLAEMAAVLKALGDDARQVQPLFVTVDPARDTSAVLKNYTSLFDPRILGLSGSPELTRSVADHFKVRFEKVQEPGAAVGNYTVDHSAGMFLLGRDGRFLARFPYAMPVPELTRRIEDYLKASR